MATRKSTKKQAGKKKSTTAASTGRKRIKVNVNQIEIEKIKEIVKALKEGKVIIYPTETVYGLGASIFHEKAVRKVHKIKKESQEKPLSVAFADVESVANFVDATQPQLEFIRERLPGPVTIIVDKKEPVFNSVGKLVSGIPDYVSKSKIGVRIPEYRALRHILQLSGPITSTSANIHSEPAPWSFSQINVKADIMVDGGMCKYKKSSQIIDMTTGTELRPWM